MIELIVVLIATIIYYTYHALEDVIDSRKEATIVRLRKKAGEEEHLEADFKLKGKWHFFNWIKIAVFGLLTAYLYASTFFEFALLTVLISTLRVAYFNPLISIRLGSTFFHLGKGKLEILFEGKEKLYYIINLIIFISCLSLLILKTY